MAIGKETLAVETFCGRERMNVILTPTSTSGDLKSRSRVSKGSHCIENY
jgi:hypothetical protein